ncbi:glycerate kinase family protein [Longirhabdus pacifica]|uniref:glycerate kinase family protein n=1 Tax=Longirhabdus pacifica TaxID=2305227 RepID=UPI00100883B9|nr:glycerate kinase [Longirhabdus pacifica]
MNILVAMDSLKGSLSSSEANEMIKKGLQQANPQFHVKTVPIADGGEGTVDAFVVGLHGTYVKTEVTGPLGTPTTATYGLIHEGKTAVIEVAEACGLPLVDPRHKQAMEATSYGVGELICHAIDDGCESVYIGLGGSATTDAGVGMLQALGFQFLDANGNAIGLGGKHLTSIQTMNTTNVHKALQHVTFHILCDVQNPLYGPNGAAYIFSPQKGASPEEVQSLDKGLQHFSSLVHTEMGVDLQRYAGGGAAGGLGAACLGFLQGEFVSGVSFLLEQLKMEAKLRDVQVVITGEGRLDAQSAMGKAPTGIAKLAKQQGIAVIALAGDVSLSDSHIHEFGIDAFFSIVQGPISLQQAIQPEQASTNLLKTAEQVGRLLCISDSFMSK